MLSGGRDELDGANPDPIFDDEQDDEGVLVGDECASDDGGAAVAGGEADEDDEEGLLLLDADGDGGDGGGGAKDSSGELGSGGDVECPECGKFFKNDKSMFGHLRSHPNRGYKGATPPVKKLKLSPDTAAASPSSLPPGTVGPSAQHSGRDPRLTPFEILCACVILTLRFRDNGQAAQAPPPLPPFSERKLDAVEQIEGGTGGSVTSNAAAEVKSNAGPEADSALLRAEHCGSIVKIPKKRRNMPKDGREAQRKVKLVLPSTKEKRPYICKHCQAEFPTHQALGGHMAGHHREKKVLNLNEKESFRAQQGTAGHSQSRKQAESGGSDGRWRDGLSLPRGLLARQFTTANGPWQSGQASGGNKRQGFERRNDGSSSKMAPLTADGDRRMPRNFDLNVEAPEQD